MACWTIQSCAGWLREAERTGAEIAGGCRWTVQSGFALQDGTRGVGFGEGEVQAEFHAQLMHVVGQLPPRPFGNLARSAYQSPMRGPSPDRR